MCTRLIIWWKKAFKLWFDDLSPSSHVLNSVAINLNKYVSVMSAHMEEDKNMCSFDILEYD